MIINNIAVIGSTTIDKIIRHNISCFKIGGVTTYAGITYSRHGIKTLVITNIASRNPEIIKRLKGEKIVVCNGPTPQTTHFINYVDNDLQKQKIPLRAAIIRTSQISEHVKDVHIVHLGPLHPYDIDIAAIKRLDRFNLRIILDVQGYTRSVRSTSVYPAVSKQLRAALKKSHIVKANQKEFDAILDYFQMDLAELMNHFNISEFILTCGDKGGFVQNSSGEKIGYHAAQVGSIEDPTGSGDLFLAAYVIDRLLKRRSIPAACKYAANLAARQIEGNYIKTEDLGLEDCQEP